MLSRSYPLMTSVLHTTSSIAPIVTKTLLYRGFTCVSQRHYSFLNNNSNNNRTTATTGVNRRFRSELSASQNYQEPPVQFTIENSIFLNNKMSQVELANYNRGLRLKLLKEQLNQHKLATEELEQAVMEYKSNFM